VESIFFFSLFLLSMMMIYSKLPNLLYESLKYIPAPVMTFNYFFLFLILMWITIPIMGFRLNESLDVRKLLQYPISFPILYIALALGNFIDTSSIVPITILAALSRFMWISGTPESMVGIILLSIVVFLFLQLIYQSVMLVLYNLLPRFNPLKLVAICLGGVILLLVLMNLRIIVVPEEAVIFDDENLRFHNKLPSGTFAIAAYEFFVGNMPLAYKFLLKSVMWLVPVAIVNFIVTFLTYRGHELGFVKPSKKIKQLSQGKSETNIYVKQAISKPVFAIFIKDAQAFFRDWHYMFYKLMPGIVTPTLVLLIVRFQLFESQLIEDDYTRRILQFFFIMMVIVLFLAQAYIFVGNLFGYDRAAISNLFTAPIDNTTILVGKNLFIFLLLTLDSVVIALLTYLFYEQVRIPLAFFFVLECMVIILLSIGNVCSMVFPFYVPFDKPSVSFQGTLIVGLMNLVTDFFVAVFMVPIVVGIYHALSSKSSTLLALAFLFSIIYSLGLYVIILRISSRMLDRYRESIYHSVSSP
jgi:hypothetical protein